MLRLVPGCQPAVTEPDGQSPRSRLPAAAGRQSSAGEGAHFAPRWGLGFGVPMLPRHRSRMRPLRRQTAGPSPSWLTAPVGSIPWEQLGRAAGPAPTQPRLQNPPSWLSGGLGPPSSTADLHQQPMVRGPARRCAGTATPSGTEQAPSGTADACRTSHRPARDRPPQGPTPPSPRQDLQPLRPLPSTRPRPPRRHYKNMKPGRSPGAALLALPRACARKSSRHEAARGRPVVRRNQYYHV